MYLIKYPFKVKIDETYYPAKTPIEVANADEHVARGAVVIQEVAAAPKKAAARKTRKAAEE